MEKYDVLDELLDCLDDFADIVDKSIDEQLRNN